MTGRHRQRGAATVIAAVFLVVSLSLMVNVALHMAGSDINDTAMHSDAIEALFIAETGLEQASYWYDSGVACALLDDPPYNTDTVARGSFTITSAVLVGSLCSVTVDGEVDQTYAVKRRIQGELEFGGSGGGVWAVGKEGEIQNWGGSSWTNTDTLAEDLNDVVCSDDGNCWAVGKKDNNEGLIAQWDGSSWRTTGFTNNSPEEDLLGVACIDFDDCWAVGKDGTIVRGLAGTWDDSGFTNNAPEEELRDVYCVSSTDCWAVGKKDSDANIVHWDGGAWSSVDTGGLPDKDLNAISCVSSTDCWAVGKKDSDANIAHWDGGAWSSVNTDDLPDKDLNGVSCVSENNCWAVGKKDSDANIVHWDGDDWSSVNTGGLPDKDLKDVHCIDTGDCWAVGKNGTAVHLQGGTTWNADSPGGEELRGVFISGGGGGTTRLVNWQELVN